MKPDGEVEARCHTAYLEALEQGYRAMEVKTPVAAVCVCGR